MATPEATAILDGTPTIKMDKAIYIYATNATIGAVLIFLIKECS